MCWKKSHILRHLDNLLITPPHLHHHHLSPVLCLHLLQLPGTFISISGHFPSLTCTGLIHFLPRSSCCTICCAGISKESRQIPWPLNLLASWDAPLVWLLPNMSLLILFYCYQARALCWSEYMWQFFRVSPVVDRKEPKTSGVRLLLSCDICCLSHMTCVCSVVKV